MGYTSAVLSTWMLVALLGTTTAGSPGGSGNSLLASAAASGRPRECASSARRGLSRGPSVWEVARVPNLQRYCDLVARAHAQLASTPDAAKESAELAEKALPGRASPAVILARASLALGSVDAAAKSFAVARAIDPRSLEDPSTMHDFARVLVKTGKISDAITVYRALVPRIDLLATADKRISVLLEAAHVSMAVEGAAGPEKSGSGDKPSERRLDEAAAYLREARQRPATQFTGDVLLSLVLALDRGGDRELAEAALADAHRLTAKTRAGVLDYLAAPEDKLALDALSLEGSDRGAAIKSWEAFLAGPGGKGPWAAAARARLDAMKKGGGKSAKARPSAPPPRAPGKTR
jgi:tetratricopeptide (TPR) repeat protein